MGIEAFVPLLAVLGAYLAILPWFEPEDTTPRTLTVLCSICLMARYEWWRFSTTLPDAELGLGCGVSYALALFELAVAIVTIRKLLPHVRRISRSAQADASMRWYRDSPPLVDVLVPTYNESQAILEKTIVGCQALCYPRKRVWLLDDSRRDWLRDFAAEMGVNYLRRPDNSHYKAGNLNHALGHLTELAEPPDFVAVFDADFVPQPAFLERTMALMSDPRVGLCQTPQSFYNPDPLQYAFRAGVRIPDEQRYFFAQEQPSLDAEGHALCCGTSFLARAAAIREIGGFPTESVTEDVLTSVAMWSFGWKTVYLNEALSFGLAPEGLHEYLTQRGRWCLGRVQMLQSSWGPLVRGTRVLRWLQYFEGATEWSVMGILNYCFLLMPGVYALTGWSFIATMSEGDVLRYIAPLLVQQVIWAWLTRGVRSPLLYEAGHLLAFPTVLRATVTGLRSRGRKAKFAVTDKGAGRESVTIHWGTLRWLLLPMLLNVVGMGYWWLAGGQQQTGLSFWDFGPWAALSLAATYIAARGCVELPQRRSEERFSAALPVTIVGLDGAETAGVLRDLSLSGARLEVDGHYAQGAPVSIAHASLGSLCGSVVRSIGTGQFGLRFQLEPEQRRRLTAHLFTTGRYVRPATQFAVGTAWKLFVASLLPRRLFVHRT